MTDCGCEKAKAELEEYLHNELRGEDAADIREHMENCVDCAGEHRVGVVLTEAVKRACKDTAPEELRVQVLGRLRALTATH
ncbi:zf-HC2 domain-containing protein [Naasia sp. SYSU D00948]|uniref:zf-HC2 domain-containing protein n=1 Tax=Naasia sp. SYSU D00948 TaxID=2817379 RepID=UPI001B30C262|nr:zf-HC2 domain-containing protein [Naasia sp. SYSU D00948]